MLQSTINGLVLGGAYALVAVGFVVLFNNTGFFNFAQGDFLTLGAYLSFTFTQTLHLPWPIMLLLIVIAMTILGLATELLTRPVVRRRALLIGAIATLGLGLVIRSIIELAYGANVRYVTPISSSTVHFLGTALAYQQLIIVAAAIIILIAMYWTYERSFTGLALKATAEDPTGAQIMGVRTAFIVKASFVVSSVLAGLAGALLAPLFGASPELGYLILFTAVIGAMVGGFGSLVGAVIGCLVVGAIQLDTAYLINANYQNVAIYGLVILLFIIRPSGVFGTRLVEKV